MAAKRVHIKVKKTKILWRTIGAYLFVALGVWLLTVAVTEQTFFALIFNVTISFLSILFFGFVAFLGTKSLYSESSGLTITTLGIEENSAPSSIGLIKWQDIESFSELSIKNQDFLVVVLKNPEDYIGKATNFWQRNLMKLNYKGYGSPICIGAQILDCDFDFLKKTVIEEFEVYNNRVLK